MKQFNYSVISTNETHRFTFETNDVCEAISAMFDIAEENEQVCICNGYTGEVLCHNGEEPWCTDEMALMILGYLCAEAWGEEDEDDEPAEETGGEMVLRLIAGMGGLPS